MIKSTGVRKGPPVSGKRALSLVLGIACSLPLTSTLALAHASFSTPPVMGGWQHPASPPSGSHAGSFITQSQGTLNGHTGPVLHGIKGLFHNNLAAAVVAGGGATGGANLNLTSSQLNFLAGNLGGFHNLTIDVGGHSEVVGLKSRLTAAEAVAVEHVIIGGASSAQTIKLTGSGAASGGTVSLNNGLVNALDGATGNSLSSLTIAKGLQVIDSAGALDVSGKLINYGSLQTAASTSGSSDAISALSILNTSSGTISSYGGGGALVSANPILSAASSITNAGAISSTGNLTLNATVVTNAGSHGAAPSVVSNQNLNINTQNLTNSGNISALNGNVNYSR